MRLETTIRSIRTAQACLKDTACRTISIDKKAVKSANLVYTMDDEQANAVMQTYGVKRKVKSLSSFCGGGVLDPYGYDEGAYEATYSLFLSILPNLYAEVTKERK